MVLLGLLLFCVESMRAENIPRKPILAPCFLLLSLQLLMLAPCIGY